MIAIMTMQQSSVYFQCHPLVYLIKLHIEMNMAELIVKIRKSAQRREVNDWDNVFFPNASPHNLALVSNIRGSLLPPSARITPVLLPFSFFF